MQSSNKNKKKEEWKLGRPNPQAGTHKMTCAPPCPIQCQSKRFDLAHGPFSSRERKIFCKMTLNGAWGLKINIILVVLWVKRTMYPFRHRCVLFAAREKKWFRRMNFRIFFVSFQHFSRARMMLQHGPLNSKDHYGTAISVHWVDF